MSINHHDLTGWSRISVSLGGAAWTLIVLAWIRGLLALSDLEVVLLLALLVVIPLALALISPSVEQHLPRALCSLAIILHPVAALIGGASLLLSVGPLAAAAATGWLLFTALIALIGAAWLFQRGGISLADTCLAVALVYLPIGGVWLVLARSGSRPLGFGHLTVLLTAVHFHFITLAALIITGLTGHIVQATQSVAPRRVYRVAAIGMLVNPLLVAAGITLTQVTGIHLLESVAAVLLALSLILIALLSLRFVVPVTKPLLAKGLLAFSGASVLLTMGLAGAYAVGAATGAWTLTISQMIAAHGWVNALGFGCCGLLGWWIKRRQDEQVTRGMEHARHHDRRDRAHRERVGRSAGATRL